MGVTASQTLADLVRQVLWRQVLRLDAGSANGLLLEFDRHLVLRLSLEWWIEGSMTDRVRYREQGIESRRCIDNMLGANHIPVDENHHATRGRI